MIKVLIVDDSPVVQEFLKYILESDPEIRVVGVARNGEEAKVIAIGASTGGPLVLHTILSSLPPDLPVPLLVVQHMATGFIQGFVEWLAQTSRLPVHVARHGERLSSGHVYISPDGVQMAVAPDLTICLTSDSPENGLRPSVSYLFRSVAQVFGPNAVGVLLTGMGKDGAQELQPMQERGAITIAQDKESSVVHGMPGEAISLAAATYVLPPEKIVETLVSLTSYHAMILNTGEQ